jgi:hypothetical protein
MAEAVQEEDIVEVIGNRVRLQLQVPVKNHGVTAIWAIEVAVLQEEVTVEVAQAIKAVLLHTRRDKNSIGECFDLI